MMEKKWILLVFLFVSATSHGQESMIKFVGDYFRVDPFEGRFSDFTKALSNDKRLLSKEVLRIYDPKGISIAGSYSVFNPFSINASNVEMNFRGIGSREYFGVPTPMYIYELTARFTDNPEARKKIRRDYWLMLNRFRRLYTIGYNIGTDYPALQRKHRNKNGESTSFFFAGYKDLVSSRLIWTTPPSTDQIEVKISVCFAVINDRVYPLGHYPGRIIDEYYDLVTWKENIK